MKMIQMKFSYLIIVSLLANAIKADAGFLDYWHILNKAGRTGLINDFDAINAVKKIKGNPKFTSMGLTNEIVGDFLKLGWPTPPANVAFNIAIEKLDELITALPTGKTTGLQNFLGAQGFKNGNGITRRHSYVQLERLLENKTSFTNAIEVKFEFTKTSSFGTSVADIHIKKNDIDVIEIETKAGMEFFENVVGSNFEVQCANSLLEVNKIENYRVFLNPEKIKQITQTAASLTAAKNKIIAAWKNGELLADVGIMSKFETYFVASNLDDLKLELLLKNNDNWFKTIFLENL
jgi:hypothetical protein